MRVPAGAPRRVDLVILGAILAVAAALRLPGLRYGLPLPVLNPDEENIVPRAWRIVHGGGLDPGWYDYPSLLMLVLAPGQALVDHPSYAIARVVAFVIGLGGVAATWWLGRVAYGRWAAIVGAATVAVATTHVAYSRMAVTDGLLLLGVVVALALMCAGRLEWAGVAVGLAMSAKYPGLLLAVPLAVAGWSQWRRLGKAAALAVVAFVLTSPFVLVHAHAAWDDIRRVQDLAQAGWLGFEDDPVTPIAFLERLWETLGPFVVLGAVAIVVAAVRRRRADLVLLSFVVAYWLWLMPLEAHFDRYVLPLVPVIGVLVGRIGVLVPFAVALLAVPLAWSIADTHALTGTDTRLAAARWVREHVPVTDGVAFDPSSLSPAGARRFRFTLPGPGRPEDPRRDLAVLRRQDVRWVVVTGAVADRVAAAAGDYPRTSAFYAALARRAVLALELDGDDPGLAGPWVRVYRLPEAPLPG